MAALLSARVAALGCVSGGEKGKRRARSGSPDFRASSATAAIRRVKKLTAKEGSAAGNHRDGAALRADVENVNDW
jgi:hypothetical protein